MIPSLRLKEYNQSDFRIDHLLMSMDRGMFCVIVKGCLLLYDVYRGVFMEPMQGKLASSQFDFVYTEQFCILG